jgi:predicted histone-like DNA-binding protein
MKVEYHIFSKRSPRQPEAPPRYYPGLKRKGTICTEEVCEIISGKSSLTAADVQGVLVALGAEIERAVQEGKAIKLDFIGTFSLGIKSEGDSDPDKIRPGHIKSATIKFLPDLRIKRRLKKIRFKRVSRR